MHGGLNVAINDDIRRRNLNLDWSRLIEYNSKEFLARLCIRNVEEDNNQFFINFENIQMIIHQISLIMKRMQIFLCI